MDRAHERRRRAIAAATAVAARHGVECGTARILADANNTIVHLAPAPLVAKAGTSPRRAQLRRDLDVAAHAAAEGAPVVPPSRDPPPGPHREGDLELTLWELAPVDPAAREERAAGEALREVHRALETYPGELPSFLEQIDEVGALLAEADALPALASDDRAFLAAVYSRLREQLCERTFEPRPLHGAPHEGNVAGTRERPLWLDFETACLGPAEWDAGYLAPTAAKAFRDLDRELVELFEPLRSLVVAVRSWMQPDRDPAVREAARFHLDVLRRRDDGGRPRGRPPS
jgi:Phosphotransferase enzyme family